MQRKGCRRDLKEGPAVVARQVCVGLQSHVARTHSQTARASAATLSVCHLVAGRVLLWMAAAYEDV